MNDRFSDERVRDDFESMMNAQEVGAFGELTGAIQEFEIASARLYELARELCIYEDIYGMDHMRRVAFKHAAASTDSFGAVVHAIILDEPAREVQLSLIVNLFLEDEKKRMQVFDEVGRGEDARYSDEESLRLGIYDILQDDVIDEDKANRIKAGHGVKLNWDIERLIGAPEKR